MQHKLNYIIPPRGAHTISFISCERHRAAPQTLSGPEVINEVARSQIQLTNRLFAIDAERRTRARALDVLNECWMHPNRMKSTSRFDAPRKTSQIVHLRDLFAVNSISFTLFIVGVGARVETNEQLLRSGFGGATVFCHLFGLLLGCVWRRAFASRKI